MNNAQYRFGELLFAYRSRVFVGHGKGRNRLTQAQFAEDIAEQLLQQGIEQSYGDRAVGHWERGRHWPVNRDVVVAIIAVLCRYGVLTTRDEANELLSACSFPTLTEPEVNHYLALNMPTPDHLAQSDLKEVASVLGIAAEGILQSLGDRASVQVASPVSPEIIRVVLKGALGNAIRQYATGERLEMVRTLMRPNGFMAQALLHEELGKLLIVGVTPDYAQVGMVWSKFGTAPFAGMNWTEEARRLFAFVRNELSASDLFSPLMEAATSVSLDQGMQQSVAKLGNIESQVNDLLQLLTTQFAATGRQIALAPPAIRQEIRDFTLYIQDKTQHFVGRGFVEEAIDAFIRRVPRGYFWIRGDPGLGKTAIAAHLVKTKGYLHHFNIRTVGINKTGNFLSNICAQLIAVYALPYTSLPPRADQDAGTLIDLLSEVSLKLARDEKCVIVVDALDEVEGIESGLLTNPLLLPNTLPPNIYIILTSQRVEFNMRIECEFQLFDIAQDDERNASDIQRYLEAQLSDHEIQAYLVAQHLSPLQFTTIMAHKSQGNFMYLHYVIPEIAAGTYHDQDLRTLPEGLENYYKVHWVLMKGKNRAEWFEHKLPVLVALTAVREPVSFDLLARFSKVKPHYILVVLEEWERFLYVERTERGQQVDRRYRLYHNSFFDFISNQDAIQAERVNLRGMHGQIAEVLLETYYQLPDP